MKIIKIEKDGCVPCQLNGRLFEENAALLDEYGITVETVNVTKNPEAIEIYDITSVPVTLFQNLPYEQHHFGLLTTQGFRDHLSRMIVGYPN